MIAPTASADRERRPPPNVGNLPRANRRWWTFGSGKLHVEQISGSLVSRCGRELVDAVRTTHPANWRDACRHCVIEILRDEIPGVAGAAT